jgi:hypothetical protein
MSHRKHRTTVVTFREDLTKTTYSFNSKPDLSRIYKEAMDDGVAAFIMFPARMENYVMFDTAPFDTSRSIKPVTFMPRNKTPMLISVIHTVLGGSVS